MNTLHNKVEHKMQVKPEEGLQAILCSQRESSSSFNNNFISENDALDYLAEILVEAFLDNRKYNGKKSKEKCSDLC